MLGVCWSYYLPEVLRVVCGLLEHADGTAHHLGVVEVQLGGGTYSSKQKEKL